MKRLLVYLKEYKKECVLAPLFKMLEASFELFVPLVVAKLIDEGIGTGNNSIIFRCFLLLVALGLIGLTASLTAQFFAAKAAVNFASNLRHSLFEHLLGLDFEGIDKVGTSTMITRMTSDVNQLQNGVNMVLRLLLRSPFVVFGALVMAFTIDVKSSLIFLIVILLLCIVVFGLMSINIPQVKKVQENLEKVLGITRQNLNGVRVIRAFCKEDEEIEAFDAQNGELTRLLKRSGNTSALTNPITFIMINIAIILLINTGAIQVTNGILTAGQVVALYNYMSQILVELIKMADLIVLINKTLACGNRVATVFDMNATQVEGVYGDEAVKTTVCVEFKNVSLKYNGAGEETLSNIDFVVNKGETVGIIGGTGSGKSSLIHLIPRFYDATEGEVLVDGVNVRDYKYESLRKKVGIVMQKSILFKGNIESNLKWADGNATDEECNEALKNAMADGVVADKGGLEANVEKNGLNFSGGQKQRISIARTLLAKPEILILDDSFSALDYLTDLNLRKNIKGLDYNPTVFIVSQRSASIMYADKIIVMDDGKIVGLGKHDELLKSCEVYREIYESQYGKEVQA